MTSGAAAILRRGGVGILPTDTLYGIVGQAFSREAVRRIYLLRRRNPKKPMIILIGDIGDLRLFGIRLTPQTKAAVRVLWPGKVSVLLDFPLRNKRLLRTFSYLHRGTKSLAFRLPAPQALRSLLRKTGPLVAPSANFEGEPPALTPAVARAYFGDRVDFYLDRGRRAGKPSTLVRLEKGRVVVLREGAVRFG